MASINQRIAAALETYRSQNVRASATAVEETVVETAPKYKYSAVREFLDLRVTGKDAQPVEDDRNVKALMGYGHD